MLRVNYTNPLTKQYQAEYAMYKAVSKLFAKVECRSAVLEQLKLYHAELVKLKTGEDGEMKYSYKKQEELDKQLESLAERFVAAHADFPDMKVCRAVLKIRTNADRTHCFTFTDRVYGFSVSVQIKKGRITLWKD